MFFEFQNALANKDLPGCIRIVQYFEANPKAAPIQLIFPSLYSFFSNCKLIDRIKTPGESYQDKQAGDPTDFFHK